MKGKRLISALAVAIVMVAVTAAPMSGRVFASHSQAGVTGRIGFMFDAFTTSARWEFDKTYVIQDLKKVDPGVKVDVNDAKLSETTQISQSQSELTKGAKALIVVPNDQNASKIIKIAHANKPRVPVLAYDRLIPGAYEDAYASFNGYQVGVKQGQWLLNAVSSKPHATIVEIGGCQCDPNAILFHNGARSVLDPANASGKIKIAYFKYTPQWSAVSAQQEMASALNSLGNKVDGVLVANDGMAAGIIAALTAQHLNGKVPITGQDATVAGLQQILLGNQGMTIYKPLRKLAAAATHIVNLWLHHKVYHSATKTTIPGVGKTPSAIIPVITVTKSNIKSTVIKDGFVKKSDLCKGIASACSAAGI